MIVTSVEQKQDLIEAGKRLGEVLRRLEAAVAPGVSTEALDDLAESLIRERGDEPAFLGYTPEGAERPYPATLCVSINDEVVHGIPNEDPKILKEGDIVGLDLGLTHNNIIVDAAVTVGVGKVSTADESLMRATEAALAAGIKAAHVGGHVGDISAAIQQVVEGAGCKVIKVLGGHGVGEFVHEEPFVPNFGKKGEGPELVEGMVLALEPIATLGKASVILDADGYTYRTRDGARSSHHEHTILLESAGARIITL
jgi:methionyl aminopeptidase